MIRGGRGSVRAGKGERGSAGASPSQNVGHRTWEGEALSEPAKASAAQRRTSPSQNVGHRTREGEALSEPAKATAAQPTAPSQDLGDRSWEGEAPSEPAKATAAQQELRPPKTWATELGRAKLLLSRD